VLRAFSRFLHDFTGEDDVLFSFCCSGPLQFVTEVGGKWAFAGGFSGHVHATVVETAATALVEGSHPASGLSLRLHKDQVCDTDFEIRLALDNGRDQYTNNAGIHDKVSCRLYLNTPLKLHTSQREYAC
jgi:hypothetical protein